MKTVVFVGAHDLMVPYINDLAVTHKVIVYDSGVFSVPLLPAVTVRTLPKKLFGIQVLIRGERSAPWYMSQLTKSLRQDRPDDIIVLDFIRLWYLQTLHYCLWHPQVKLHVYSETQRVPRSVVSASAFVFFFIILRLFQKRLTTYFTFTSLGHAFASRMGIRAVSLVLPPPIDVVMFKPNPNKIFLPDGVLRLLVNARYVSYKRHGDIFKAVASLVARGKKITVTCIGRGDQRDLSKIEQQADQCGIRSVVRFVAPAKRADMPNLYQEFDVLVLASDNDAIGMVVPEAMACGIPTITSDTVGANVYVENQQTGFICKTKDSQHLAEAMLWCADKNRLQQAGASAREQIESKFTGIQLYRVLRSRISQ